MKDDFFRFPSTPHLSVLGDYPIRDDKVMSDAERIEFLRNEIVVEEKVDGANLGISFDSEGTVRAQNRGSYISLPGVGQWKKLGDWLSVRTETLFEQLVDRYILFGEWCYARHSLGYDRLPDWFLGFDVYDRHAARFVGTSRRHEFFQATDVFPVPLIGQGHFTLSELTELLTESGLGKQPAEGLYLRYDEGDWLVNRAKLVRPSFIQSVQQHWSRSPVQPNRLLSEATG